MVEPSGPDNVADGAVSKGFDDSRAGYMAAKSLFPHGTALEFLDKNGVEIMRAMPVASVHANTVRGVAEACVTRHTSHVTRHTSHVTRHTSHVTRHTSHVTSESVT